MSLWVPFNSPTDQSIAHQTNIVFPIHELIPLGPYQVMNTFVETTGKEMWIEFGKNVVDESHSSCRYYQNKFFY